MPNIQPIFTRIADIQAGAVLTAAAADYIGQNVNNSTIFKSDPTSGGFVQKLRFKSLGTNVATVARVYINANSNPNAPSSNVPQTLTGTPSGSGGSLLTSNLVAKVASVDQWGVPSAFSTESANVAVTGPNGSIAWNWNASSNSNTYIIAIGQTPGSEERAFIVVGANTFTQTNVSGTSFPVLGYQANGTQLFNNYLYGEIGLPATTASASQPTPDIEYPLNIALPPGFKIIVGLGTAVSAGWAVTAIGGKY